MHRPHSEANWPDRVTHRAGGEVQILSTAAVTSRQWDLVTGIVWDAVLPPPPPPPPPTEDDLADCERLVEHVALWRTKTFREGLSTELAPQSGKVGTLNVRSRVSESEPSKVHNHEVTIPPITPTGSYQLDSTIKEYRPLSFWTQEQHCGETPCREHVTANNRQNLWSDSAVPLGGEDGSLLTIHDAMVDLHWTDKTWLLMRWKWARSQQRLSWTWISCKSTKHTSIYPTNESTCLIEELLYPCR